jgi:hypothetical protein
MVEKRLLAALPVTIVGLVSIHAGAPAAKRSHCRRDCRQPIATCLARVPKNRACTGRKAEKKLCRRRNAAQRRGCQGLVKVCKQQNPSTSGVCVSSGPPGPPGTPSCMFVSAWGSSGTGAGQFDQPLAVAIDPSGNVYVAGQSNNRVQKFDANGVFLAAWGSYGAGNGQFAGPTAVATDASGSVYVADQNNDRIQKFACP